MTTDELIRLIGKAFYQVANTSDGDIGGWTSVEAFARITGLFVRTNARPGEEENVMNGAIHAMCEGFDHLKLEDFLPFDTKGKMQ